MMKQLCTLPFTINTILHGHFGGSYLMEVNRNNHNKVEYPSFDLFSELCINGISEGDDCSCFISSTFFSKSGQKINLCAYCKTVTKLQYI